MPVAPSPTQRYRIPGHERPIPIARSVRRQRTGTDVKPARQKILLSSTACWNLLLLLAGYRRGMPVREVLVLPSASGETGYYFCPRCHVTMEREFLAFCDRCGQRLDWKDYRKARKIYPGRRSRGGPGRSCGTEEGRRSPAVAAGNMPSVAEV